MFSCEVHHDRERLWLEIYDHESAWTYRSAPKLDSDLFTALSQEDFLGRGVAKLVIMDSQQGSATRAVVHSRDRHVSGQTLENRQQKEFSIIGIANSHQKRVLFDLAKGNKERHCHCLMTE
jgi:hypothetical protein